MKYRTLAQILGAGIKDSPTLQESLQSAIRLEFSTVPPYLCAEWSIKDQADPVAGMIHTIVIQEMLHMGLAANMLVAIGGKPVMTGSDFAPNFPTDGLPGNVHPHLKVDLLPLGPEALKTFMEIELPEKGPIAFTSAQVFPTIGEFYDAIGDAFQAISPPMTQGKQVVADLDGDSLGIITKVSDAVAAIDEIKQQGEGTTTTPFEGTFDPNALAHFYVFKGIAMGHALRQKPDGTFAFDGTAIPMPAVFPFKRSTDPTASADFNVAFSDLLRLLERAWTVDPDAIDSAVNQMFTLKNIGTGLITKGITPEFRWTDKSSLA